MQSACGRAKLACMATPGYPLLVLYCPYCREGGEAAAASSLACPRCGRPRMKFSGANWATDSGEMPVTELAPQLRYVSTKRPAAVDQTVRNVQFNTLR
jgi:hypothetical protein